MVLSRRIVVIALVAGLSAMGLPVLAQQLPTPDQARILLQTRPDLVALLRREIANSGLSSDQIRARLIAAGYPEDILDSYLPARSSRAPSSAAGSDNVADAVSALGLMDSTNVSDLRSQLRGRGASLTGRDSSTAGQTGLDAPHRRASFSAADTGQTVFGLSVFEGSTTRFDPNLSGPVDASYRFGAGDQLVLIITGDAERALTLDVTREGFVVIPGVGQVPVANLTLGELENQLYAKLGRVYSGLHRGAGATTHFSINVARLHRNQVYVLGDVTAPGSFQISSAGTALTALYAAGGPTLNGGMRRVEIRRGGKLIDTLDLYDYLLRADGTHDPRLQSGDVIFLPVHGPRVRVHGEVVRPGTYELRVGESLTDLLRAAGGFTADASRQRVQVSRVLPPSQRDTTDRARVVIDVTASTPTAEGPPAFPLEAGDVVRVFRVNERVTRRVTVDGNVNTPGVIGFTAGMRLSDAIRRAGGVKPDAYLDQVLISRLRVADSSRVQLRAAFRDSTGVPINDIALQEDDEIRVFSVTEFREPEYVVITGAVRRPGRYPYRDGISLRDVVLLAGGLDARASVSEAEIARPSSSRADGRLAVTERVPIDSSYLRVAHANGVTGGTVAQAGSAREVPLRPFDNILIPTQADWTAPRSVVISGEVAAPGTYTLLTKTDRLSDLLKRAGGLTSAANPDGIVFRRRQGPGRVGIDLRSVLRDPSARDNLLLVDGDSIHLPQYSGIVEVLGAVNAPRGVPWVPGKSLDYYIRAAGGSTRLSDVAHSYVTQPDGSVETVHERRFLPDGVPKPRPGSVVTVTARDPSDRGPDAIVRLTVLAQIVGSLVAIVALVRRP